MLLPPLKKCPFCGSKAFYGESSKSDGYCSYKIGYVACDNPSCGVRTPSVVIDGYYGATTKPEDAIKVWNRRVKKWKLGSF